MEIIKLDLSNNDIRDVGVEILSKSLGEENKCLISLNLSSNSITHQSMPCLSEALLKNQSLIELNLSSELEGNNHNKLGP
jgi:Ran GTPase-activating protein (RanGAP) involved in mRNA processing and transport